MKSMIKIPDYWTPEQATAVFELVEEVRDALLRQYQLQIMQQLKSERPTDFELDEIIEESDIPF
jgi:hypothetical protein